MIKPIYILIIVIIIGVITPSTLAISRSSLFESKEIALRNNVTSTQSWPMKMHDASRSCSVGTGTPLWGNPFITWAIDDIALAPYGVSDADDQAIIGPDQGTFDLCCTSQRSLSIVLR